MAHITRIAFCGLRRLNAFRGSGSDPFLDWIRSRKPCCFASVNILIGGNGGGKSTLIDLIDSIRDPDRLVSLPRENMWANSVSAFEIVFDDDGAYYGRAISNRVANAPDADNVLVDGHEGLDIQHLELLHCAPDGQRTLFQKNISKLGLDDASRSQIRALTSTIPCHLLYWQESVEPDLESVCRILNRAAEHLPGILSASTLLGDDDRRMFASTLPYKRAHPFGLHSKNRLDIWLSDDVRQSNHVHFHSLPAGWKRLVSIVDWLEQAADGSICLIEEPETHLHPTLQRHLAHEIDRIVHDRNLQLFIATHSPVFQQVNVWKNTAKVFAAVSNEIVEYTDATGMLDQLGIKASDISQSNGIVWVEGPSDRIYIKHWLALWCKANGKPVPIENVDYSFSLYGGASLAHFSAQDTDEFIAMLGMNRHCAIVIDRDRDFDADAQGRLCRTRAGSAKGRVIDELRDRPDTAVWITEKYTIEGYLPPPFFNRCFSIDEQGVISTTRQKVSIAQQYVRSADTLDDCASGTDLLQQLECLHTAIHAWSY
ncbi:MULTISPECIES: AAA family ATPase [Burkholderia]|nr:MULTISPECIES: AAA family ATPase [Burkholderia]EKS9793456.1 AAA family ATPase [Burkholderia cepacia]EKS9801336.1 AAA family ATPase [Burkholderia cepacia]EKS9808785.1 AAA family ATPase [Burkholderia cepacia]EKS9816759.1 AAA family ATPase [Burkholderia cepacia]EKS9824897.1 AAA family ATPase [Burkholderia cepacia]